MADQYIFSARLPVDKDGYIGRMCPKKDCRSYFKVKPGTGLSGDDLQMYCPYCGYSGEGNNFLTSDQTKYVKSLAVREIQKSIGSSLKAWGTDLERSTRGGFLRIKFEYKENLPPIQYYREKSLETNVHCVNCSLDFSIFGLFAFCPDCGVHNSIGFLEKNLELASKEVDFATYQEDPLMQGQLVENALQNAVAAFDGFGRALCLAYKERAKVPDKINRLSFQNIPKARKELVEIFGYDLSKGISAEDWQFINKCFQKRHLFSHKLGIVDQEYLDKTHDKTAKLGLRVLISNSEVILLISQVSLLGKNLSDFFH